jgi:integral membrane protein (TIGR01906 family)
MNSAKTLLKLFFTLSTPIILSLISVRIVMSPTFLSLEYNRDGFPDDRYGFTLEERLSYSREVLDYLIENREQSFLSDMTFENGERLFTNAEIRHMEDVRFITYTAYSLLLFLLILTTITFIYSRFNRKLTAVILQGFFQGALLTLGLIGTIVCFALIAWNSFFDGFHMLLFEAGTWRFSHSDTLIRLFPEQFWFDAALTTGVLTCIGALLILIGSKIALRQD